MFGRKGFGIRRRYLALTTVAASAAGMLTVAPSATIHVSVAMTPVSAWLTAGARDGTTRNDVAVTRLSAPAVSDQRTVPVVTAPQAAAATGTVRFDYDSGCFIGCPAPPHPVTVPSGAVLATCPGRVFPTDPCPALGIRFVTEQAVTIGPGREVATVPIRAVVAGPDGNVPAMAVRVFVSPPSLAHSLFVGNGVPTSGGMYADVPVPDGSAVSAAVAALDRSLRDRAGAALQAVAGGHGMTVLGQPTYSHDQHIDAVPAGTPTTMVHVSVGAVALAASRVELDSAAGKALDAATPHGLRLIPNSVHVSAAPDVAPPSLSPMLQLRATAIAAPIDSAKILQSAAGRWQSGVVDSLRRLPGVAAVRIERWPFALPYLPLISNRIDVRLESAPTAATGP